MKKFIFTIMALALFIPESYCTFPLLSTNAYYNYNGGDIICNDPADPSATEFTVIEYGDFCVVTDAAASTSRSYTYASSKIRLYESQLGYYFTQFNESDDDIPDQYYTWQYDIEVDKAELTVRANVSCAYGPPIQTASASATLTW
ncbi:MAG: hypothetical protein PVF73_04430 [Bacteroidales bacterium]|jgi:hypothetical protein